MLWSCARVVEILLETTSRIQRPGVRDCLPWHQHCRDWLVSSIVALRPDLCLPLSHDVTKASGADYLIRLPAISDRASSTSPDPPRANPAAASPAAQDCLKRHAVLSHDGHLPLASARFQSRPKRPTELRLLISCLRLPLYRCFDFHELLDGQLARPGPCLGSPSTLAANCLSSGLNCRKSPLKDAAF
jgi:hypothetical protein